MKPRVGIVGAALVAIGVSVQAQNAPPATPANTTPPVKPATPAPAAPAG